MTSRSMPLALAVVRVAKVFGVPFMGLAGTCHQKVAEDLEVAFIAGTSINMYIDEFAGMIRCRVVC